MWTKGLNVTGLAVEPNTQHKHWLHAWRQGLGSEGYQRNQTWEDGPSHHPVRDKLFVTWQINESLLTTMQRLALLDWRFFTSTNKQSFFKPLSELALVAPVHVVNLSTLTVDLVGRVSTVGPPFSCWKKKQIKRKHNMFFSLTGKQTRKNTFRVLSKKTNSFPTICLNLAFLKK